MPGPGIGRTRNWSAGPELIPVRVAGAIGEAEGFGHRQGERPAVLAIVIGAMNRRASAEGSLGPSGGVPWRATTSAAFASAGQRQRRVTRIPPELQPKPLPARVARSSDGSATRESATPWPTVQMPLQPTSGV